MTDETKPGDTEALDREQTLVEELEAGILAAQMAKAEREYREQRMACRCVMCFPPEGA